MEEFLISPNAGVILGVVVALVFGPLLLIRCEKEYNKYLDRKWEKYTDYAKKNKDYILNEFEGHIEQMLEGSVESRKFVGKTKHVALATKAAWFTGDMCTEVAVRHELYGVAHAYALLKGNHEPRHRFAVQVCLGKLNRLKDK